MAAPTMLLDGKDGVTDADDDGVDADGWSLPMLDAFAPPCVSEAVACDLLAHAEGVERVTD